MKLSKCPAREQKMRQEKRKKGGGEKVKSKSRLKILLSAQARTSQANILLKYFASGSNLVPRVRLALSSGTGNGDDPCR